VGASVYCADHCRSGGGGSEAMAGELSAVRVVVVMAITVVYYNIY
jgi:hypothetical protein